jgi:hypothetical protein
MTECKSNCSFKIEDTQVGLKRVEKILKTMPKMKIVLSFCQWNADQPEKSIKKRRELGIY